MRYLELDELLHLHAKLIAQSGGASGVLDLGKIESCIAQPKQGFGGRELYPSLFEKAAALGYSLACNHGFRDGNKRIAQAALELVLLYNGFELEVGIDEQEQIFLELAAGKLSRQQLTDWVRVRAVSLI